MRGRTMRMIEIEVFLKAVLAGTAVSECCRIFYIIGGSVFRDLLAGWHASCVSIVSWGLVIVGLYLIQRSWVESALRFVASRRLDVAIAFILGIFIPGMLSEELADFHRKIYGLDYGWGVLALMSGLGVLSSPMLRNVWVRSKDEGYVDSAFISDEEIDDEKFDFLENGRQAKAFAKAVLEGGSRRGMVFGVDGPWGIGKTSFINLAEKTWLENSSKIVVFRFEPAKFLQSSDILRMFVQELSGALRSRAYAPEFKPLASKYSNLLKAEPEFGIPGLKITLGGAEETVDEMLSDLDEVLARLDLRVVVVIDDLDRLEPELITSILFLVRRSWSLTRASYVLAYDTERIISRTGSESTREYLEKFVGAKFSLFIDFDALAKYLMGGWKSQFDSGAYLPSARLLDLSSVLSALADILMSKEAANYVPVLGNMRKLKRFINALFLVEIEKLKIHENDFSREDLIHLIILYVCYPGIFRDIYNGESERRKGVFSVERDSSPKYFNDPQFAKYLDDRCPDECSKYIVRRIFDAVVLRLDYSANDRSMLATRACFNSDGRRNLARYLALIVRNLVPEPLSTEAIYNSAVSSLKIKGDVARILSAEMFKSSALAHEKFWSELSKRAVSLDETIIVDAIDVLVDYLNRYRLDFYGRTGRSAAIYSLAIIVDAIGWRRRSVSDGDRWRVYKRICELIMGDERQQSEGIICRLSAEERGVLGMNDMMLFRLLCCGDRGSQLTNIRDALAFGSSERVIEMPVRKAVVEGMRAASQFVFGVFRARYIDAGINFLSAVDDVGERELVGNLDGYPVATTSVEGGIDYRASRSSIKIFVPYQLSNKLGPDGSGVGCGYYDEFGSNDAGGIQLAMSRYLLDVCFSPPENEISFHFADHCLSNMSSDYSGEGDSLVPYFKGILAGMDRDLLKQFWREFRSAFMSMELHQSDREVVTVNYTARYSEYILAAWKVLDDEFMLIAAENADAPDDVQGQSQAGLDA